MARGRMISRTLSTSARWASLHTEIPALAEFAQVLWTLLVAHSDDYGRLAGDPFTVKHAVVPTSPRRLSAIRRALTGLDAVGLISWYSVEGREYIQITRFDDHQTGLHKRTSSHYPDLPGTSGKFPLNRTELKRTGTEQKGNGETCAVGVVVHLDAAFARFWAVYPKKQKRGLAEHLWAALEPDAALVARILAAVATQRTWTTWTKQGGSYIPMPDHWLRDRRWEDEPVEIEAPATTVDLRGIVAWVGEK